MRRMVWFLSQNEQALFFLLRMKVCISSEGMDHHKASKEYLPLLTFPPINNKSYFQRNLWQQSLENSVKLPESSTPAVCAGALGLCLCRTSPSL